MRALRSPFVLSCLLLLLAACGGDSRSSAAGDAASGAEANLPKPDAAGGSVTGMPDTPGPGPVGPPPANPALDGSPFDTGLAGDGSLGLPPADGSVPVMDATAAADTVQAGDPQAGDATETAATEPTPQDAVAVVREYYAALDARQFARAQALWSDGGKAGTQTPPQFADDFADAAQISVETRAPGRVDAAAGSRYIQVPVAVRVGARDGSVRRYVGTCTLRRAVVAGASAEQRAWRIAAADLREVE